MSNSRFDAVQDIFGPASDLLDRSFQVLSPDKIQSGDMAFRQLAMAGGGLATLVAARSVWMDERDLSTADVSHAQTRLASLDTPASLQEHGVRRMQRILSKSDAEAWAAIVRHETRPVPWPKKGDGGDGIDPVKPLHHVRSAATLSVRIPQTAG